MIKKPLNAKICYYNILGSKALIRTYLQKCFQCKANDKINPPYIII